MLELCRRLDACAGVVAHNGREFAKAVCFARGTDHVNKVVTYVRIK